MTKPHNFLPGDRIVAVTNPDDFGTVVTPEETHNPKAARNYLSLRRDRDGHVDFWSADYWKPAPITVGSWVRVTDEFAKNINPEYIGYVFKIERMDRECTYHTVSGISHMWNTKHLRAVAEPVKLKAVCVDEVTFDLASGPDFTGFHIQQFGRAIRPDILKQAQRLAETLDRKHFGGNLKVPSNLTGCLNVIDHMTAHMDQHLQITENARLDAIGQRDELQAQITKLADFITGEPSQSAGAVDTAIRIMTEQRAAISEAGSLMRDISNVYAPAPNSPVWLWLERNAPQPKPVFKRGDLVWTGFVFGNARIITNDPMQYATVECMNDHGQIVVVPVASLRQAAETK